MLRHTYLFENIMFTNKVNQSIAWVRKERIELCLLLMQEFEKALEKCTFKDLTKNLV